MTSNKKDPVLVVLQMTGAYDALNTFIPPSIHSLPLCQPSTEGGFNIS